MNPQRRAFFQRAALVAAIPTIGIAKVVGVRPVSRPEPKFLNGMALTAEDLNGQFTRIIRYVEDLS